MQITNRNANKVDPLFLAAWLAAGDTGGGVVRGSSAAKIHAPEKKGGPERSFSVPETHT